VGREVTLRMGHRGRLAGRGPLARAVLSAGGLRAHGLLGGDDRRRRDGEQPPAGPRQEGRRDQRRAGEPRPEPRPRRRRAVPAPPRPSAGTPSTSTC
jgi:hypothetical protein